MTPERTRKLRELFDRAVERINLPLERQRAAQRADDAAVGADFVQR